MKAKEIQELYDDTIKLTDGAMTLVCDNSNGTFATGLRNIRDAVGNTIENVYLNTSVDSTKLANGRNQTTATITQSESGPYKTHKTYTVDVKLPKIVSMREPVTEEIPQGHAEAKYGGTRVIMKSTDSELVPDTSFVIKNGTEMNLVENPEATVSIIGSKENPKVTVTVDRASNIENKEIKFDFELPAANALSNVNIDQNENPGKASTVTFGFGAVIVDGDDKKAEHEESVDIYNGNDGFGYFDLEVNEDGHLILYAQDTEKVPDFFIGENDGHLYVKLGVPDEEHVVDLGTVVKDIDLKDYVKKTEYDALLSSFNELKSAFETLSEDFNTLKNDVMMKSNFSLDGDKLSITTRG